MHSLETFPTPQEPQAESRTFSSLWFRPSPVRFVLVAAGPVDAHLQPIQDVSYLAAPAALSDLLRSFLRTSYPLSTVRFAVSHAPEATLCQEQASGSAFAAPHSHRMLRTTLLLDCP